MAFQMQVMLCLVVVYVYHIKDGNAALYAKRLSSHGDIAKFYIDSTHVGTIGTEANDLTIFTQQQVIMV